MMMRPGIVRRGALHSGLIILGLGAFAISRCLSAQLPAYNVPDDPAFVFLDVSPKRIASPGTLPALGLALADGIDIDGHVNAGVAISFLPSNLIRYTLTPEGYRNGSPGFWFYNTLISVGTVRKSGDTAATDLAFGFRTILRGPEPYSDPAFRNHVAGLLDRCLTEARRVDTSTVVVQRRAGVRAVSVRDSANPTRVLRANDGVPAPTDTIEITYLDARGNPIRTERAVTQRIRSGSPLTEDTVRMWKSGPNDLNREAALECGGTGKSRLLKAWMKDHWNDATLAISAATGTRLAGSAITRRAALGSSLWLLGAVPIRWTRTNGDVAERMSLGQIAAQLHYISTPGGIGGINDNSWEGGIRAMAGRSTVNGFVEATRNLKKSSAREDRSSWATGVEFMVAESLWISAGVGERYSTLLDDNRDFVFLNLKWALAREARLGR